MEGMVLIADDDKNLRTILAQALTRAGAKVRATATLSTLWRWLEEGEGDVVLTDVNLLDGDALEILPRMKAKRPDLNFVVMSAQNTVVTAMRASELGAYDYLAKPFDLREMLTTLRKAQGNDAVSSTPEQFVIEVDSDLPLVGTSEIMQEVYKQIARIIQSDLPIVIHGAAGTGKSLIAEVVHKYGARKDKPFVRFHGNETSYDAIVTAFEKANGGSLVLESIDEFFMNEQRQIQTILEDPRYDFRLISTTSRNLRQCVDEGKFRETLYFRMNVLNLELPDLVDRDQDSIELAHRFLTREPKHSSKRFDAEVLKFIQEYAWPGNVGELELAVSRALALSTDDLITTDIFISESMAHASVNKELSRDNDDLAQLVERRIHRFIKLNGGEYGGELYQNIISQVEKPLISTVLKITNGNQIKAAEILNINRNTLRKKIANLDILVTKSKKLM